MARKKKHPEHVNHERWLVSYADFITLLFAFFVVMFAVSQVDSKKVGRFTESFNDALEWQVFQERSGKGGIMAGGVKLQPIPKAVPGPRAPGRADTGRPLDFAGQKVAIRAGLAEKLQMMPELAGLDVLEIHGELVLRLPEHLIFDVGDARLRDAGKKAIGAIAAEVQDRPVGLRIEGHTDSKPIHTARFPTNWELSTARATAVVAFLLDASKIEPARLAAAGYAEYHPIAQNDTPEGRAQNRRVDLIVVAEIEQDGKETKP
jgi:chemotaxis protein MotB